MPKPNEQHPSLAERLFAAETHADEARSARGAIAGRLHQKLFTRLQTLVGRGGARAVYRRSMQLAEKDHPSLAKLELGADDLPERAVDLSNALAGLDDDAIEASTIALTATVLALLVRLIGEPLTLRVLRSEWPHIRWTTPNEEKKNE